MKQNHYATAVDFFNSQQMLLAKEHALKQLTIEPRDINTLKLLAFIEYQSNQFQQSLKYLEKIIKIDENIAEINNLVGCIFLKSGDFTQSVHYLSKSIENDATYIDAYTNLAVSLQKLNQPRQAIEVCNAAVLLAPNSIKVLSQCASITLSLSDFKSALNMYRSWIKHDPYSIQANTGLAKCYLAFNEPDKVVALLNQLKLSPTRSPMARLDVTNELLRYDHLDAAIVSYKDLIDDIDAKESIYNNIANAYDHLENTEKAIEYFSKALTENKNYVPALSNIARIYTDINQLESAEQHLLHALEIEPDNTNTLNNMGRLYEIKNEFTLAEKYFLDAIKISPHDSKTHYNLGNAYHQLGDFERSCQHYKTCLSIDPDYADAEQNLSINELAKGKFDTAWGHYFKRVRNLERGEKLSPITPGMSLSHKRVYFCRSQGIGDELFFLRFLPELKKQNSIIIYRASKKAYPLLSKVKEIDHLLDEDEAIPDCDYYFTIDDLPLILNIDDASKILPPLTICTDSARVEKAKNILEKYPPPYTGITWRSGTQSRRKSNKNNQRDLNKVFPIKLLKPILTPLNGSIIVLQRNPDKEELDQLHDLIKLPIVDLSQYNDSLEDMLALLSLIDNYLGVSNTNTHLYAALNKKANVLIPHPPDWRWMTKGASSPWFPGFGIFRQKSNGDWKDATDALITKLGS